MKGRSDGLPDVPRRFEAVAAGSPSAVAVVAPSGELTYGELNRRANALARRLRRHGVAPEVRVGLCLERSPEGVVAILAVWKAGGAYVPLDPEHPPRRLASMLRQSAPRLVLASPATRRRLPDAAAVFDLDEELRLSAAEDDADLEAAGGPQNLAYVIFTSGSSGRPKGVEVTAGALSTYLGFMTELTGFTRDDVLLAIASFGFDMSVREHLVPLLAGGKVVLTRRHPAADPAAFRAALRRHRVTCLLGLVPSLTGVLFDGAAPLAGSALRLVGCGGEPLPAATAERLRRICGASVSLLNQYGPTECTGTAAAHFPDRTDEAAGALPVGTAHSHASILVAGPDLCPVAPGESGEVLIAGGGLARGYAAAPAETAARFVPHPGAGRPGERLYRTGDLGRFRGDGRLEVLGRLDRQLKLRGLRVEPAEVESVLAEHPGVAEAAVALRHGGKEPHLVAFYTARTPAPETAELLDLLTARLPPSMVPAGIFRRDRLPRTPTGKLDRRRLDEEAAAGDPGAGDPLPSAPPRSPLERQVAAIWEEVLGRARVGRDDDFLLLGGHSLDATRVVARIERRLGRRLPPGRLFESRTVAALAADVEAAAPAAGSAPRRTRAGAEPALSFAQSRMWFLQQLAPRSPVYNLPDVRRLLGRLDVAALRGALGEVVRRHEVLRTRFPAGEGDGRPRQEVTAAGTWDLPLVDLTSLPGERRPGEARRRLASEGRRPFRLDSELPLRSHLWRLGATEHLLFVNLHHIASDGWSQGILSRELTLLVRAAAQGEPSPLPEPALQYADFAVWQRESLSPGGERPEALLAYWRRQLAGLPVLELPADRPRPAVRSGRGGSLALAFPGTLLRTLRRRSAEAGVSPFMTLLAAFAALLHRFSGQDDVAVGSPIANRRYEEVEGLIGFFANTLVLRGRPRPRRPFGELLAEVRQTCLDAYRYQDLPFEKLIEDLAPERDLGRSPLFQVMLVLQNAPREEVVLPGLRLSSPDWPLETSPFDLTLSLAESPDGLTGRLRYAADLFDATTIHRFAAGYEALLTAAVEDPRRRVGELRVLSPAARHQLLREWNDVRFQRSPHATVVEGFEAQAAATPDAPAVAFVGVRGRLEDVLTYRRLDERANQLARHLRRRHAGAPARVGLCVGRGVEMAVALLGILKAGAAYVPLDPADPVRRLAYMVEAAGVSLVVTHQALGGERLEALRAAAELLLLDAVAAESTASPGPPPGELDLAYVIFTSGSTGRPKGVAMPHAVLAELISWHLDTLLAGVRCLQFASLSFDGSFPEIFATWCSGGFLVVAAEEVRRDAGALLEVLTTAAIEKTKLPVVVLQRLAEEHLAQESPELPLRELTVSGSQLQVTPAVVAFCERHPRLAVHNHYGPSETHAVTAFPLRGPPRAWPALPPVGRPISGAAALLLDAQLECVPVGVEGEIHLGGRCPARGYFGRPAQSAQRFVPDPFSARPGGRLYRTGDRGRYLGDGNLRFLGRRDHQVKLRGFRIELGEIEAVLSEHPAVREAAVTCRRPPRGGAARLVAYVAGETPSASGLRDFLSERLPEVMVPATFVVLDALPVSTSGKVDRAALPPPGRAESEAGRAAPRTPTEEVLLAVWEGLLGVEGLGIHDPFFQSGGHSLLAAQVVARIRRTFRIELPVRAIFERPSVATLAVAVDDARRSPGTGPLPPLRPRPRDAAELPLSFAQQRLWFLQRLRPAGATYSLPGARRLLGRLDPAALERALAEVVRRHEVLRTRLPARDGRPYQEVEAAGTWTLPLVDLTALPPPRRPDEARRRLAAEGRRPFHLEEELPLRSHLWRLGAEEHVLFLNTHHVASDGWSREVLHRELARLYGAFLRGAASPLPEPSVQYADFAAWQRRWLRGEVLATQLAYWRRQLDGLRVPELPPDRRRPAFRRELGAGFPLALSGELHRASRRRGAEAGASLFMVLLAGWMALLHRLTGRGDVAIGSPVANRRLEETEGLIGFFVNTLVLRGRPRPRQPFADLLARVRELCLDAYLHQDLPFEKLVEELDPERDLSRSPFFQVMLDVRNVSAEAPALTGLAAEPFALGLRGAPFELTVSLGGAGEGIRGSIGYDAELFSATTVARLARSFESVLSDAVADPSRPLLELSLLDAAERHQTLVEWNDRDAVYPAWRPLHVLVEDQAARTPDAVAIAGDGGALTYGELVRRAARLAARLRALGVGAEARVGVCLEPGADLVVALVAVWKAGGAYVALDPGDPPRRLAALAGGAGLAAVVAAATAAVPFPAPMVCVDAAGAGGVDVEPGPRPESAAYVLYTSGSTGAPRGVVVSQGALVHHMRWMQEALPLRPGDRVLQKTPLVFDASVWEFWAPLLVGARVVTAPPDAHRDPAALLAAVRRHGVTVLQVVPSLLRQLVAARELPLCRSLRRLCCGGEPLSAKLRDRFLAARPGAEVVNLYGPTETTIHASYAVYRTAEGGVTLGRPISNTRLRVLGAGLAPAAIGAPGRLFVAGPGLARGYLGGPRWSAERFLPDPFSRRPGGRLYDTGDRVRYLAGGELEFLGRADAQVKLRGVRLEPGEVEAALEEHPAVRQAVVALAGSPERLTAFLLGEETPAAALRAFLETRLSAAAIPAVFLYRSSFPRTASGKVDRRALRRGFTEPAAGGVPPRDAVDEVLAEIWSEVLGRRGFGVHESFFALGGHSLLATQVLSRVRRTLGAEVSLRRFFERPSVAGLRAEIAAGRRDERTAPPPLVPGRRGLDAVPSFAQERLSFLHELMPRSPVYHMWGAWHLAGRLDLAALERAHGELLRRHEALRSTFVERRGRLVCRLGNANATAVADLTALPPARRRPAADRLAAAVTERPFDLARGPLARILTIRLGEAEHVYARSFHHAVFDGASQGVFDRELEHLYRLAAGGETPRLPEPALRYADFAAWQREWLRGAALERQLEVWRRRLAGLAAAELPGDRPPAEVVSDRGEKLTAVLPSELLRRLRSRGAEAGATLFMTTLAAFLALVHRWTSGRDLAAGTSVANRRHPGTEELVGLLVNTLVLRVDAGGQELGFLDLLGRLREVCLEAYDHQDLPFEKLVAELRPPRDLARTPFFQTFFELRASGDGVPRLDGLAVTPLAPAAPATPFDLVVSIAGDGETLAVSTVYRPQLFDRTTIARLLGAYVRLLAAVAEDPGRRLDALPVLAAAERHQVLVEWNDTARRDGGGTVIEEILARALAAPEAPALAGGGLRLSYGELARRVRRLAAGLRRLGAGAEVRVGVGYERSPEWVLAVCGVLAAGAAFVPLDPEQPDERLRLLAGLSGASILLTREVVRFAALAPGSRVLTVDAAETPAAPPPGPGAGDLAYVLFTSGSTGRPKGVEVAHAALANHARGVALAYGLGPGDRVLQLAAVGFDVVLEEVLPTLARGGAVVLRDAPVSTAALTRQAAAEGVTVLNLPTSFWHQLTLDLAAGEVVLPAPVRLVVIGSERAGREPLDLWRRTLARRGRDVELLNAYGTTEATVTATWLRLGGRESRTRSGDPGVGRPIRNVTAHVLGPDLAPLPAGAEGHLHLGGAALARGYLAAPRATAAAFVPDPFRGGRGARLYRTGDRARRLAGGGLELLGRLDDQVKVRGRRVEPGEVEALLLEHPAVREAAVVAAVHPASGETRLVAFFVPRRDPAPGAAELRAHLAGRFPAEIVPRRFVARDALPLLPTKKVDRRSLVRAASAPAAAGGAAPSGSFEDEVARIWCQLLELDEVDAEASFFDLGGHSLLLVELRRRLRAELGRDVAVVDLFRHPTVRDLARHLAAVPEARPAPRGRRPVRPAAVAIIGMSGRFPGAAGVEELHRNLRAGVESIAVLDRAKLRAAGVAASRLEDPDYVPACGVLEGAELFDAGLFGMSPGEAAATDPQQRLFLEHAWEALEHAGYDPQRFTGRVAVFAGASKSRFTPDPGTLGGAEGFHADISSDDAYLATRVSYKLDLRGPATTVRTACSTSLVAVHLACQSLLAGDCEMALAGGVSLFLPQQGHLAEAGGVMSADGRCRAFDAAATGTVGGHGLGLVVLRRLDDALSAGDSIHAVLLGSAVNNDGAAKVGFTAPSVVGQAAVVTEALARAGVDPETVGYVEAHGTGTALGDPIEVAALTEAFRRFTEKKGFCALGSVKTNIGHLDTAAGVAGLIKTVLALQHGEIPPSLHFERPNPEIDFDASPFFVNTKLRPWPRGATPRRAGVSSFGIGGTNAHVVVEEAPPAPAPSPSSLPLHLLVLSAGSEAALEEATARLAGFLERRQEPALADVAFTLQTGRRELRRRRIAVCRDAAEAVRSLRQPRSLPSAAVKPGARGVVFLFPGGGAQYAGMGRELYAASSVFRREVDRCAELFEPHLGLDLRGVLYASSARRLTRTSTALPALFATELALASWWRSLGVEPRAVIGHSLGEYTAACVAGVLPVEDAVRLVAVRGRLMERLPPGAMLSVALSEEEVLRRLPAELDVAAVNAPDQAIVAGERGAVERFERDLAAQGLETRRLEIDVAAHSRLVEPILDDFAAAVETLRPGVKRLPWVSNLTGDWIGDEEAADPSYWVRHLRRTVRFSAGLRRLFEGEESVLLEVGPGRTLGRPARRQAPSARILASLPGAREAADELQAFLTSLGRLWLAGVPVRWEALHEGETRRRVALPTYPFERTPYGIGHAAVQPARRLAPERWTYMPCWQQAPPLRDAGAGGTWLLLADGAGLAQRLSERLAREGRRAVLAAVGASFEELGKDRYVFDPARRADYDALLSAMGEAPARVVHLLNVDDGGDGSQVRPFWSLVDLVRAWSERGLAPLHLAVVTSGLFEVTGGEALAAEKALALGPARVLGAELAGSTCRTIDVVLGGDADRLAAQLLAEVAADGSEEPVALRGRCRWTLGHRQVELEVEPGLRRLRRRGVYLITGGLGGIGLALAEHLAKSVEARLVLVARTAFPDPGGWPAWLAEHGEDDETSRRIRRLQAVLEAGGEVTTVAADVADRAAMAAAVESARRKFGALHGVVHAAGTFAGGLLQVLRRERAEPVFASKVTGTRILDDLLGGELDFLVLCSSLSSRLGGVGAADYCAANSFLDAFARARGRDKCVVSINWDSWQEDGMAEREARRNAKRRASLAATGIPPGIGAEVFLRALGSGLSQVLVSTTDLDSLLREGRRESLSAWSEASSPEPAAERGRPELDVPYVAPREGWERTIAGVWCEILGIEGVGSQDSFFDLGGDSLIATRILSRLRRQHGLEVPLHRFFAEATVAGLARVAEAGRAEAEEEEEVLRL